MTLLAIFLMSVAVVDATRLRPTGWRCVASAGIVVALVATTSWDGVVDLTCAALLVVAACLWTTCSRRDTKHAQMAALAALGIPVLAMVALNGATYRAGGTLAAAVESTDLDLLDGVPAETVVLACALLVAQTATANHVVRAVLRLSDVLEHLTSAPGPRGGRLLGPMERLFILGLGLAGELTAASVVIAAKALLRYPEVTQPSSGTTDVRQTTEYLILGSFVSWMIALTSIALVRLG